MENRHNTSPPPLPVGKKKALFIARTMLPEFVFNMARLEGNTLSFEQVQAVMAGSYVTGVNADDLAQVRRIAAAWSDILARTGNGKFALTRTLFIETNAIIARNEALMVGCFRSGQVSIAGTDYLPPSAGEPLEAAFTALLNHYRQTTDTAIAAFGVFLNAARAQFFYDGNKRTGQLVMNAILLNAGYAPTVVFANTQAEYDARMLAFYQSGDKAKMLAFLKRQYARVFQRFIA